VIKTVTGIPTEITFGQTLSIGFNCNRGSRAPAVLGVGQGI